MSEEFTVAGPVDHVKQVTSHAVAGLGWKSETTADGLVAKPGMGFTAWPSTLDIGFHGDGEATAVTVDGHIYGFGPVQKKHLKSHMGELRTAVESNVGSAG